MSEQVNFTISTGLKNIIGKELITDDFIAIFELVKNSYDAQAENVWIVFKDIESDNREKGRIIVIDDGYGMSKSDIDNKWLFVGYSEKKYAENYRDKIGKRRIFSGAKGIGRFSCDRISRYLYLYTKIDAERRIHKLSVDWDLFEADSQEEFQTINIDYNKLNKIKIKDIDVESIMNKKFVSGTILELVNLNEKWDREKLKKLKRHLQRLVNPVQIMEGDEFSIHLVAEEYLEKDNELKENRKEDEIEYHNIINGLIKNVVFEQLAIKTIRIEVEIEEKGTFVTSRLYDKNKKIYEINENLDKGKYSSLFNIQINLFYLSKTAKSTFTRLMGLRPVEFGSIFLYKNGFRISPYGNERDDWLGLDRRKLQSYHRRLANRELIGRIEIWGTQKEFQEVSSRDGGVIKTPAFAELKEFFKKFVIERLEKYVVEGINWDNPDTKPKTQQEINIDSLKIIHNIIGNYDKTNIAIEFHPDLLEIYEEKQVASVPEIINNIQHIKESLETKEEKEYVNLQTTSIRNTFRSMMDRQKQLEKEIKQTERQALFSKFVAGEDKEEIMGLQHQIGISADTIRGLLDDLKVIYIDKEKDIPYIVMKDYINSILIQVESIYSISQFVTKTKFDLEARKIREDIIKYISDYIERIYKLYYEKEITNKEVEIVIKNEENSKFIYDFSSLDFMIIVDNLIDNSIKANSTLIEFSFNVINENKLNIHVKDNGEGIQIDNHDKIFDFGFTTTGGSGIGLNQIKKIMEEYGDITTNKNAKIGAEFILEVKK